MIARTALGALLVALIAVAGIDRPAATILLKLPDSDLYEPSLAAGPGDALLLVALAFDGEGDRVVAWTRESEAWSGPVFVTTEPGALLQPRVRADRAGFVVSWSEASGQVHEARFEDGGFGESSPVERPARADASTIEIDGELWSTWSSFEGNYADGNYEVHVRSPSLEQQTLASPGADLHPQVVPTGEGVALVWTNSYFSTRKAEPAVTRYDKWIDKVHKVSWLGADGLFSAPLELRPGDVADRAFAVPGDSADEVWILYDTPAPTRGEQPGFRTMLYRVTPAGAGAPVPIGGLLAGPQDSLGVVRSGERLVVAKTVRARRNEPLDHSRIAVVTASPSDFPEPEAGGRPEGQAPRAREPVAAWLDLASTGRDGRFGIEHGGRSWQAYYGNLHLHSNLSWDAPFAEGLPAMNYRVVQEVAQLDFAALTDHVEGFAYTDWWTVRKTSDLWDQPGTFVTFPGYEWTSMEYGHKNVIFAGSAAAAGQSDFPARGADRRQHTPDELWEFLATRAAVTIPHHVSTKASKPTDWSYRNDEFQRLVEIFQIRGNFEYDGAPFQPPGTVAGHSVRDALAQGHRLGIVASPDHGGGRGLAGVWAAELTREGLFEGLHARRTFGTTGAKMALFLGAADAAQGAELPVAPGPLALTATVYGTADGLDLTLVSDGEELWTRSFEGRQAQLQWLDERELGGTRYYYLRATQGDGHIGWTSPVWVHPGR